MVSGLSGVFSLTVIDELDVLEVDVAGFGVVGGGVGRLVLLVLLSAVAGSTASTAYALKDMVVPLTALTAPDGTSYPSGKGNLVQLTGVVPVLGLYRCTCSCLLPASKFESTGQEIVTGDEN